MDEPSKILLSIGGLILIGLSYLLPGRRTPLRTVFFEPVGPLFTRLALRQLEGSR